ncbi:MAG: lycopene cyclase domain-containing protein [Nitrososphaerota archaeon]
MTYFGFLLIFLVFPILLLLAAQVWHRQNVRLFWWAIGAQVLLALIYTTPWDNHLVATGVWYYNPKQVAGILLGYVPLEEYAFFVLETLLAGLWWRFCSMRIRPDGNLRPSAHTRLWASVSVAVLWSILTIIFFSGWKPGTYLLITLTWALPPIILQLAYGADILWHKRRLVAATIVPLGIYLSAADALAIRAGIWAIDPRQSTGVFIGGLPIEEAVFFFVTIVLITFGMTLTLSEESRKRLPHPSQKDEQVTVGE